MSRAKRIIADLRQSIGKRIKVELKDKTTHTGILTRLDVIEPNNKHVAYLSIYPDELPIAVKDIISLERDDYFFDPPVPHAA